MQKILGVPKNEEVVNEKKDYPEEEKINTDYAPGKIKFSREEINKLLKETERK